MNYFKSLKKNECSSKRRMKLNKATSTKNVSLVVLMSLFDIPIILNLLTREEYCNRDTLEPQYSLLLTSHPLVNLHHHVGNAVCSLDLSEHEVLYFIATWWIKGEFLLFL